MKIQHCSVDLNSRIANLTCVAGASEATLSFRSLVKDTVNAVKFVAKGYNANGEMVFVEGKDSFLIILQNLSLNYNETISAKVKLPSGDIRRLELEQAQFALADGTVLSYEGENRVEYDIEMYDDMTAEEAQQLEALKDFNGGAAVCRPAEVDGGWVCLCGHYNKSESTVCSGCDIQKDAAFDAVCEPALGRIMANAAARKTEKTRDDKKNRNVLIGFCGIAVLLVAAILVLSFTVGSHRSSSSSKPSSLPASTSRPSASPSSGKSSTYESALSVLSVSNVKVTSNSSYTVCTGTLTNNGKKTYKFVQVKGAFQDSTGKVIDTDSTYAVGSEGLAPGESTTFRMSIKKNYKATKCNVTVYSYK